MYPCHIIKIIHLFFKIKNLIASLMSLNNTLLEVRRRWVTLIKKSVAHDEQNCQQRCQNSPWFWLQEIFTPKKSPKLKASVAVID